MAPGSSRRSSLNVGLSEGLLREGSLCRDSLRPASQRCGAAKSPAVSLPGTKQRASGFPLRR
eukprot:10236811-Alexandrium_andersonii.AAC.1